jgi:hypothetical protein
MSHSRNSLKPDLDSRPAALYFLSFRAAIRPAAGSPGAAFHVVARPGVELLPFDEREGGIRLPHELPHHCRETDVVPADRERNEVDRLARRQDLL